MYTSSLASTLLTNAPPARQWVYVTERFRRFQAALGLTASEVNDASTKVRGVVTCLNRTFYGESQIGQFLAVGSWGKKTAIHPPTDIDVFFILPDYLFHRFDARTGNKQSQLLQYVRDAVTATYPQTRIRGDGQVVVVGFNSIAIEIVPAFVAQGGVFIICDTNDGGRWKLVNPTGEATALDQADSLFKYNVRRIIRITKQWKRHCDVPIKSFHIEQLVCEALARMSWGANSEFWFDWIVRDVFLHMIGRAGGGFYMPGNPTEWIGLGDFWQSKAITAYQRACKACEYEQLNENLLAGMEWQKIFGTAVPLTVS